MRLREYISLLWEAGARCARLNTDRMAAEIAFNAMLSAAPLLLIALNAAGRLLDTASARSALVDAIDRTAGAGAADATLYLVNQVPETPLSGLTAVVSLAIMLYFSSAVFRAVRGALNTIWEVSPPPGIRPALRHWASSFLSAAAAVILFMGVITLNLVLSLVGPFIVERFPQGALLMRSINFLAGFSLMTGALLIVLKRGPQVRLAYGDVFGAALLTSSLYALANMVISQFIWKSVLASFYGAAGTMIILVLWVYYGAHILLFGAAYSRAALERRGARVPMRWEP